MSHNLEFGVWPTRFLAGAIASILVVACGGSSNPGNPSGGGSTNVQLASKPALGNYFGLDTPGTSAQAPVSNCTTAGGCLGLWPIFHIDTVQAGAGLQASDFGELTRSDGAKQTTYKGWPLYFYAGDSRAGDTNGDNFEAWYVLRDPFYSLLVMEKSVTSHLYLANPEGRAVYIFSHDTVGTTSAAPVSACSGACLPCV